MLLAQLIRDLASKIPLPFLSVKAVSPPPPPISAGTLGSRPSPLLPLGMPSKTPSPLGSISPVGGPHALVCSH